MKKNFSKGTIVIERYLCTERKTGRRRFTIAHEAAHYVADESLAVAGFRREFDNEKSYTFLQTMAADINNTFYLDAVLYNSKIS